MKPGKHRHTHSNKTDYVTCFHGSGSRWRGVPAQGIALRTSKAPYLRSDGAGEQPPEVERLQEVDWSFFSQPERHEASGLLFLGHCWIRGHNERNKSKPLLVSNTIRSVQIGLFVDIINRQFRQHSLSLTPSDRRSEVRSEARPRDWNHYRILRGNFDHGAWKSGDRLSSKVDAFHNFIKTKDASYFEAYAENMAFDQNCTVDENIDFTRYSEEWLEDRFVNTRGQYVTWLFWEKLL